MSENTSASGFDSGVDVAPSLKLNSHETNSARPAIIALLGNPNTGKTTLFNALAGLRQRVGNYPGVTVETKKGHFTHGGRTLELVDLPGTYSLAARSPDEMVAVDLILGHQAGEPRPTALLTIVDASNLERNLYLVTQALELGVPVVVALNMTDIAERQGLHIDAAKLSAELGVPVVPIQANKNRGLDRLKDVLAQSSTHKSSPRQTPFPDSFEKEVVRLHASLGGQVEAFLVRRLILDVGGFTQERLTARSPAANGNLAQGVQEARARLAQAQCPVPAIEARSRYAWIRQMASVCLKRPAQRPVTLTDRLDRILTHRFWGTLVFMAVMFFVFESIFTWARPLMKVIDFGRASLTAFLEDALPPGLVTSLLTEGVVKGVGAVVVFIPQILILFGFLAILEDCGYMARAAFLMDKLMSRCGLSGKSFIPLLSSMACAVPGIMATRVIENRRDRLATILVAPLMSCSARLPLYTLLIGSFLKVDQAWWVPGASLFGLYALGLITAPIVALILKRTLLRGEAPVFVMEMPLYKVPSGRVVIRRMVDAGWAFLRRAGTLILASMILVSAALYFPAREPGTGQSYDAHLAKLRNDYKDLESKPEDYQEGGVSRDEALAAKQAEINNLHGEWKRQSLLGRMGRAIEPVVKPLGWDWKIGVAALASFPAREVVVGTLGMLYNEGDVDPDEIREAPDVSQTPLGKALRRDSAFSVPVAFSLMVFFALCCQCASTLAVIRRETRSWRWPLFAFAYMTLLAYGGAFIAFQIGSRII